MPYKDPQKRTEYQRELREWRKQHHICVRCGQDDAYKNRTLCLTCLMDQREYAKSHNPNHKHDNAKAQALRVQKKLNNQCLACSKPRYKDHAYCYQHYISQRRAHRVYDEKNRRKHNSECRICNKPLTTKDDGTQSVFCEEHYRQYKEQAINMNNKIKEEVAMKADDMRKDLLNHTKYSGTVKWTEKVNKFSDRQVYRIWNRINEAKEWVK